MLIVNQLSGNTLCLTASEFKYDTLTGGTNTGWTLKLVSNTTLEVFSGITLTDTSSYTDRYNLFNLTLTGKSFVNYANAIVYLPLNGFYDYYIYYVRSSISSLAEQGFMKVEGVDIVTTYTYVKKNTYTSYKNQ